GRSITGIGRTGSRGIRGTVPRVARPIARICRIPRPITRVSGTIAAVISATPVAVPHVHIAVINDCTAVPVRAPAAPAPPATTTTHHRPYGNAHTEGENAHGGHVCGAVSRSDDRSAVDNGWIVRWYVHNLRICGLNDDRLGALLNHFDLRTRFQIAGRVCLCAHALHGSHHVLLLESRCLAKRGSPRKILRKVVEHGRELR